MEKSVLFAWEQFRDALADYVHGMDEQDRFSIVLHKVLTDEEIKEMVFDHFFDEFAKLPTAMVQEFVASKELPDLKEFK